MQARNDEVPTLPSKQELIVAAARKLFLEAGYGATSMDAIASQAGVSKRTVYSRFHKKELLFAAVMGDMCQQMGGPKPEDPVPEGAPEEVLKILGRHLLSGVLQSEALDLFRVVLAESVQFPELGEVFWNTGPERVKCLLSGYLAKLDRAGILSVPNPDLAALQFIGMVNWPYHTPLLFGIGKPPTDEELDRALVQAVAVFLGGLRRPLR